LIVENDAIDGQKRQQPQQQCVDANNDMMVTVTMASSNTIGNSNYMTRQCKGESSCGNDATKI